MVDEETIYFNAVTSNIGEPLCHLSTLLTIFLAYRTALQVNELRLVRISTND